MALDVLSVMRAQGGVSVLAERRVLFVFPAKGGATRRDAGFTEQNLAICHQTRVTCAYHVLPEGQSIENQKLRRHRPWYFRQHRCK